MPALWGHAYSGDSHSNGGPILQGNIAGSVHFSSLRHSTENLDARLIINPASSQSPNERDQAILDWLSTLDFWSRQVDVHDQWHEGTAAWFLNHPLVRYWVEEAEGKLFCVGKSGVGKSVLCSVLVDWLQENLAKKGEVAVVVVYCNFKELSSFTLPNLISSLVQQLAWQQHDISDDLKDIFGECSRSRTRPSISKWRHLLHSRVRNFNRVYLVVDALDELTNDTVRMRFIDAIQELPPQAHILVTSRDIPQVAHSFQDWPQVHIRVQQNDIFSYVKAAIQRSLELSDFVQKQPSLEREILDSVWEHSCETFLLPQHHVKSIIGADSLRGVRQALNSLPSDIEISYDEVMKRIEGQGPGDCLRAVNVLMWTTFACRPLHIHELQYALAMQNETQKPTKETLPAITRLISICAGMVILEPGSKSVRLAHETAQSYFESYLLKKVPDAHQIIAETCISHLLFKDFEDGPCHRDEDLRIRLKEFPLYGYASSFWGFHASKRLSTSLVLVIGRLLADIGKLAASVQAAYAPQSLSSFYPQPVDPIWVSASFGLTQQLGLLSETLRQAQPTSLYMALYFAKQMGHTSELQYLSMKLKSKGFQIDHSSLRPWKLGDLLLHHAIDHGHDQILKVLLEGGTDPNNYLHQDDRCSSPLYLAISAGREVAVKLLLDAGANPTIGMGSKSSVFRSVELGNNRILQLLLNAGADPTDSWLGEEAIERAAALGDIQIVETLLKGGAIPTTMSLFQVLDWTDVDVLPLIKLFLQWLDSTESPTRDSLHPNRRRHDNQPAEDGLQCSVPQKALTLTPMWEAAIFCDPKFRKVLHLFSDRVFTFTGINWIMSPSLGDVGHVRFCLQKGAEINGRMCYTRFKRSEAPKRQEDSYDRQKPPFREKRRAKTLKMNYIPPEKQGIDILKWNYIPLHDAVAACAVEVVSFLLDQGADVNACNLKDQNALFILSKAYRRACAECQISEDPSEMAKRERIRELLIQAGIDEGWRDETGRTAWEVEEDHVHESAESSSESSDISSVSWDESWDDGN